MQVLTYIYTVKNDFRTVFFDTSLCSLEKI